MRSSRLVVVCTLALAALWVLIGWTSAQQRGGFVGAPPQEPLQFRFVGPAVGNRISAAAGIPGDPKTYYVGAASGGVWKSTDEGASWVPVSESLPVMTIGSLAVAASDPNIIWAGTGDPWAIRDSDPIGNGIYKSTDAGKTWVHMGLEETGRIGRVVIHPKNPDIVFVAALGRLTGPQQERGVYRTTDGGKTWSRVLFADPNTGCSGLCMDPNDPNVLFAGMWQVEMHTYALYSGGPGSGVFVSRDGGTTWKKIEGRGMPKPPVGKVDVAVARSDSKRVYALIQTADQGSIWRSDDGGETWKVGSWQRALVGRAGFYIRVAVSPANPDEVLVANSSFHLSTDGGKSFRTMPWGGDTHDIWVDPLDGNRILVTHDGGMYMTTDHGKTSRRVTLPIAQLYHVAVDNDMPYHVYTNMQDNGTMRGLSTVVESGPNVPSQAAPAGAARGSGGFGGGQRGGAPAATWDHRIGGCESGFTIPDPTDSNIVWSSCYGLELTRYDFRTGLARSVAPWMRTLDSAPTQTKYRAHWTPPIAVDPFDHNTVFFGTQYIHKTTNAGVSWSVVSPDLSTADPRYIVSSGGIVGDNLGQFYGCVVFAIAPSPIQKGLIWAGTNDGKVWYTDDGGAKWNDVTANIKGVPPLGTISKIEPSAFDPGTAYVAVDLHLMDNRDPFLFKTTDFGRTWTKITGDLPKGPLAYTRVVAENPNRKGMLFAGTGNALYYTMDDGMSWKRLNSAGLPACPVSWVVVQKQAHDLVVSTYGRGVYIMDDITPLERGIMEPGNAAAVKLIAPRPAYRQVRNPRAQFHLSFKTAPKEPVQIEIARADGSLVRKLPPLQAAKAGLVRTSWDMRYDGARVVALRTTPPANPHIWEEPRFQGATTRPISHWGVSQPAGPIAAPGDYIVRATVDGQTYAQPLQVVLPPGNSGTEAEMKALVDLQLKVRDSINAVSDMVNQLEWMRKQVEDVRKSPAAKTTRASAIKSMEAIDKKMYDIEYKMITPSEAMSDDKYYVEAYRLYLNLIWLHQVIGPGGGDTSGSADYGPTETAVMLFGMYEKELGAVKGLYASLMDKDVPAYNKAVAGSGLPAIDTTPPPPPAPAAKRQF